MNILDWFARPDDMGGTFAARDARAELGEPDVYRNPYPPAAGRRLISAHEPAHIWIIDVTGDVAREDDRSIILTWGQLLAFGPVQVLPLTDAEKASEPLYGPVSARWGTPGTPCAFDGCALDLGHASVHVDAGGNPLGVTTEATEQYVQPAPGVMLSRKCTCGNHLQHQPGCDRYVTPNAGVLEPVGWTPEAIHDAVTSAVAGDLVVIIDLDETPPDNASMSAPKPATPARKRAPRKATPPTPTPRKRAPRKAGK